MPGGHDDGSGAPYSFVPGDGETVGRLLDAAAGSLSRLSDGWAAVKRAAIAIGIPEDAVVVEEAALAMGYHLRMGLGAEAAGCRLAPMTPAGEHSWPPPIANVSVDAVRLWSEAAGHVTHPVAVARLEDLLFERRDGNPMLHTTAAITAYLNVASGTQNPLDKTETLMRAWDLATRVDARDLHATCRQHIAARAQLIVDSGEHLPGLLLPLLKALARGPLAVKGTAAAADPIDVDLFLQAAMGLYPEGYLVSQVADLVRSRRPDSEVLDAVNRQEVDAYLAEANAGPALLRQTRLTDAIEVSSSPGPARRCKAGHGRATRYRPVPTRIATVHRFERGATRPGRRMALGLYPFVGVARRHSLLSSTEPPTGALETLAETERQLRSVSVFRRLMGVQLLSSSGMPSFSPTTDEEREAYEVANVARIQGENQGRFLALGLRRFAERYGIPAEEQLVEVLSQGGTADTRLAGSLRGHSVTGGAKTTKHRHMSLSRWWRPQPGPSSGSSMRASTACNRRTSPGAIPDCG